MGLWKWLVGGERPVEVAELGSTPGPRFRVVVLNDDRHSTDNVYLLLQSVLGLSVERAWALMKAIDTEVRAVVITGSSEAARQK